MKIKPIINVHTHIFSYKDVPPFMARCFLPWPFYLLTFFPLIFRIFRFWRGLFTPLRKIKGAHRKFIGLIKSNFLTYGLYVLILFVLLVNSLYYIIDWAGVDYEGTMLQDTIRFLIDTGIILTTLSITVKIIIIILTFFSAKWVRVIIVKIGKALFKPLTYLPGSKSLEFINRYLKIAIIANYKNQSTAYNKLYKMYPPGSKFVILTMDMTYMNSTPPRDFYLQLDKITEMMDSDNTNYKNMIPFLFVDPRRIEQKADFFKWEFQNGKINIAHYGGIEQWKKHLDSDRLEYAQEILEMPEVGIRLTAQQANQNNFLPDKPADVWGKADWYSIISSMMLQYENVYADISYILHSEEIVALLNLTLENPNLCKKVLFGTDYYVVRNHKSEKELYAEMLNAFSCAQLDLIARENPNKFLKIKGENNNIL